MVCLGPGSLGHSESGTRGVVVLLVRDCHSSLFCAANQTRTPSKPGATYSHALDDSQRWDPPFDTHHLHHTGSSSCSEPQADTPPRARTSTAVDLLSKSRTERCTRGPGLLEPEKNDAMVTQHTRTRERGGRNKAPQLCILLLVAALAVTALIALAMPTGTDVSISYSSRGQKGQSAAAAEEVHATVKQNKKREAEQQQRRDFVTLRDIELVGTAAAAGRVSPCDSSSSASNAKITWPPWPPHPASAPSPPSMSLEDTIPKIATETARLVNLEVQRLSQAIEVGERMQGLIEQSSCRKI